MEKIPLTKAGYEQLEKELHDLKHTQFSTLIEGHGEGGRTP